MSASKATFESQRAKIFFCQKNPKLRTDESQPNILDLVSLDFARNTKNVQGRIMASLRSIL